MLRFGTAAILTDRIYQENRPLTPAAIRERLRRELEVGKLIIIPVEPGDVLGHADGVLRFAVEFWWHCAGHGTILRYGTYVALPS